MVPPRLTLVRSTSETNDNEPAREDAKRASGNDAPSAPDAKRDAAEALAELARSALAAADVVTGAAKRDAATVGDANVIPSEPVAAGALDPSEGRDAPDEPAIASDEGSPPSADAPLALSDPEVAPPASTERSPPSDAPAGTPERAQALRILEAMLFAATEPLDELRLAEGVGKARGEAAIGDLLSELQNAYRPRGVNLVRVAGKWAFRTAEDLSWLLERHASEERRLSKAALETLSIIAYHQPVTRAEIEDIRGVSTSAGTLDILLETGWVRPRGRRRAPGRPVTYGTTESFLNHFGLDTIKDLPGLAELKGAGLLDNTLPPGFTVPEPCDVAALMPDELPLDTPDDETTQAEMDLDEPGGDDPAPEA